jgi:hypothetical protein
MHDERCLGAAFEALSGSCRSFLGPGPSIKAVVGATASPPELVGDVRAFLLAIDAEPTVTSLLLEELEGQVSRRLAQIYSPCRPMLHAPDLIISLPILCQSRRKELLGAATPGLLCFPGCSWAGWAASSRMACPSARF